MSTKIIIGKKPEITRKSFSYAISDEELRTFEGDIDLWLRAYHDVPREATLTTQYRKNDFLTVFYWTWWEVTIEGER